MTPAGGPQSRLLPPSHKLCPCHAAVVGCRLLGHLQLRSSFLSSHIRLPWEPADLVRVPVAHKRQCPGPQTEALVSSSRAGPGGGDALGPPLSTLSAGGHHRGSSHPGCAQGQFIRVSAGGSPASMLFSFPASPNIGSRSRAPTLDQQALLRGLLVFPDSSCA